MTWTLYHCGSRCVVNKEERQGGVGGLSVNKDGVNLSHWVRGELSLLINAGTASSKSERQKERERERLRQLHPRSKTTKLPHAKLLCPPCLSLSVCVTVSPPAPALPPVSLHSCSVVTLTLAAYLCSFMFDTHNRRRASPSPDGSFPIIPQWRWVLFYRILNW